MFVSISISISYLYLNKYIYIYMYVCVCVYIHIVVGHFCGLWSCWSVKGKFRGDTQRLESETNKHKLIEHVLPSALKIHP